MLLLTPAQLSHRGDHIPLVIRPWHQEEKLISQGPGETDLELAFSDLRLRTVQLVLPEPCRHQRSEDTVQSGWQRWADTAVVQGSSSVLPQGAAGSLSSAILPARDLHIHPPAEGTGSKAWNNPSCPPPASSVCPQSSGGGCTQLCSSTSPTAG